MSNRQKLQILRITSHSDLPIRNSAEELIYGDHVLWELNNTRADKQGSLAPNAFSYDFSSPLAANSTLNVTVRASDDQHFAGPYSLLGSQDSKPIFASQSLSFASFTEATEVTIPVGVVNPVSSPGPLSFRGEFTWALAPDGHVGGIDEFASEDKIELELYWISHNIHELFLGGLSGIYINFLRTAVPRFGFKDINDRSSSFVSPEYATDLAFSGYSKVYDTIGGASHFGVTGSGGNFNYRHYIDGYPAGSLYRIVNCYDQAAMVQVMASVGNHPATWLLQQPYGFINPTNLVGVGMCNNPFFNSGAIRTPPMIDVNNINRTPFARHAFVGNPGAPPIHAIYDACGGPHLGTEDSDRYVRSAIDPITNLYQRKNMRPGNIWDIHIQRGVTGTHFRPAGLDDVKVSKNMEKLVQQSATSNLAQFSQIHWDDVGEWVKGVLGERCEIAFQDKKMGDGIAESLWHLTGVDGAGGDVVVRVRAETLVGEDGSLDYAKASRMVYEDLMFTLKDIQLDLGPDDDQLETLWSPAPFGDYAQYSLQHAAHLPEGRFLIVSGNSLIDISGGSSSAALEPLVRKLLTHTTIHAPSSLQIPEVTKHILKIHQYSRGASGDVKGLFTSFDVKCLVDHLVTAASADVAGYGLLLSRYNIQSDEDAKSSTVTFTFVTRSVGTHDVDLRFGEALTMSSGKKRIQVTVVDA